MTDEAQPTEMLDPFANLDAEQRAQLEQAIAVDQLMNQHVCLPVQFNIINIDVPGQGPGIVLQTRTPAGSQNLVLLRDSALQMASMIKKAAQTGPSLVVPGGGGGLVLPG